MPGDPTSYVRANVMMTKDGGLRLKCPCGGKMNPVRGKRLDGVIRRDYMWHTCKKEPEHITEPIEISDVYWDAFTKTF